MFYAELTKSASSAKAEVREIMGKIYGEEPRFWPYGLTDGVDWNGGLYMVREASTRKPVGFTGWQIIPEGHKKVGYYSIGILPEYRRNGFAKAAVAELIRQKAASVDEVKAFIMPDNKPSHELAESLGVDVTHGEFAKAAGKALLPILGGLGVGGTLDAVAYGKSPESYLHDWTPARIGNLLLNSALGAGGVTGMAKGLSPGGKPGALAAGATAIGMIPAKDVLLSSIPAIAAAPKAINAYAADANASAGRQIDPKTLALIIAGLGIGGAGIYGANKLKDAILGASANTSNKGKVRVTLPTKNPGDAETQIEVPIEDVNMSRNMHMALARDTRRRVREESQERKWKRDGKTKKLVTRAEPGQLRLMEALSQEKVAHCTRADKLNELVELLS